jgi:hypothetical protein
MNSGRYPFYACARVNICSYRRVAVADNAGCCLRIFGGCVPRFSLPSSLVAHCGVWPLLLLRGLDDLRLRDAACLAVFGFGRLLVRHAVVVCPFSRHVLRAT